MEDKKVQKLILEALSTETDGSTKLTKLRNTVAEKINSGATHFGKREVRTMFADALEVLTTKSCVEVSEELVNLQEKGRRRLDKDTKKRKQPDEPAEEESSGKKLATVITKELWKTGEIAWRDGLLDSSYLSSNPDGITRLFCGNLNKSITEEELMTAIPGITYIKWITDKQTREFYGSTFVEMRDPQSAALAVVSRSNTLAPRPSPDSSRL